MKYKIGDKVRIKNFDWYNENKNKYGEINVGNGYWNKQIKNFCSSIMTIYRIVDNKWYMMRETFETAIWTDEMIECKVEAEMSLDKAGQITDFEYEGLAYTLPDGYQFVDEHGNEILTSKIILKKKKKEYPKTYEECCEVLDFCGEYFFTTYEEGIHLPENDNIVKIHQILKSTSILTKLIICRDAYWKIAGEEMGLGKPWEPTMETVYCISRNNNVMKCSYRGGKSNILEFPTEEMRDAFKENFDPDIEICKEFL